LLRRAGHEITGADRVTYYGLGALEAVYADDLRRAAPTARLFRVPRGLEIAQARLDRAARHLDRASELSALDPRDAARASLLIFETRERWLHTAMILTAVAVETHAAIELIHELAPLPWVHALRCAASADPLDFPSIDLAELELHRASLRPDGSAERERLRLLRRRRFTPLRSTDAPRRISRGRAPPSDSICQL
jgi:hypothetical protein